MTNRPRVVAVIEHENGAITIGRNRGGVYNEEIQSQLKTLPNCYNGQCAEVNALSRAKNKGRSLKGAKITVSEVWDKASKKGRHGIPKKPCDTCDPLVEMNGVKYYE